MQREARLVLPSAASPARGADFLLLLAPGLIWGASFLFIAEGMRSIGPNGVTFGRILIGFMTLSLFPGARRPVLPSDWVGIAGLGVLWLALPLSLFPLAEEHVSSALTGMLNGANPLFTAIVAAAFARRAPAPRVLAGVAVGMMGALLMALPAIGQGHSSAGAVGMIVAALVSYGFALNIARPLQQRNGALPVIWRAQMVALVLTAPLGLPAMMAARWRPGPVAALIALGALGTGAAHVVMSVAAGKLGATRASGTTFLIPAVALVLGVIVRGEKVALLSIVGSVVCVNGAWLMRGARNSAEEHGSGGLPDRWQISQPLPAGPSHPRQPSAMSASRSFAGGVMSSRGKCVGLVAVILGGLVVPQAWSQGAVPAFHAEAKERARVVLSKALPPLDGGHLKAILVEVNYGPGEASTPHSHPCAVIGYVAAGAIRTRLRGEPEKIYQAGESFYEAPNGVHLVSANASSIEPARLVAYLICDHDTPLTVDVPENANTKGAAK